MSWSARSSTDSQEFFDTPSEISRKAKIVAQKLLEANHCIVFTGAGISTAAGVPDFRSGLNTVLPTGPGLWAAQADYESRTGGERSERTKNDPSRPKVDLDGMLEKQPTYTHKSLSTLVNQRMIKTVLTQNVDNLHRKSGVKRENLVELHGNLQCEVCDKCGAEFERNYRVGPNMGQGPNAKWKHYSGRRCEKSGCDGYLKDYLVPFGEDLPKSETDRAWHESDIADMCIALGSSLTVTPACDYAGWVGRKRNPRYNSRNEIAAIPKSDLVIINIQKTPYDEDASVVIHSLVDDAMRQIMKELKMTVSE